jgi:hypothetical protein
MAVRPYTASRLLKNSFFGSLLAAVFLLPLVFKLTQFSDIIAAFIFYLD